MKPDDVRFQLCTVIELIQSGRPQLAADLLNDLVRSLELSEDTLGSVVQPSHRIISILRSAFSVLGRNSRSGSCRVNDPCSSSCARRYHKCVRRLIVPIEI